MTIAATGNTYTYCGFDRPIRKLAATKKQMNNVSAGNSAEGSHPLAQITNAVKANIVRIAILSA